MEARLRQINEELRELARQEERLAGLDRRQKDLHAQRGERQAREEETARILAKERADVEALEKRGLKSLLAGLAGDREERLSREKREELAAALQHDQARRDLEDLNARLRALLEERRALGDVEQRRRALRQEKEALLRTLGGGVGEELAGLEAQLVPLDAQRREVDEALAAGRRAQDALRDVLAELDSAEDLGVWDMLGGGMLVTMAKHGHIDEARAGIDEAQRALSRFRTELADVDVHGVPQIQVGEFATFADYFFDGIFADWAVQSGIHDAQSGVQDADGRVSEALRALEELRRDLERRRSGLEARRAELVERA